MSKTLLAETDLNGLSVVVVSNLTRFYQVEVLIHDAAAADYYFELSTDGGSTWLSTLGDYRLTHVSHISDSNETSKDGMLMSSVAATEGVVSLTLRRHDHADVRTAAFGFRVANGTNAFLEIHHADAVAIHDAFRLVARTSAFTAGRVIIHGIA
jgi:hypothetical protein